MAKSKNHTNHNQNKKDHRNGIKRPQSQRFPSLTGVDPKYVRNLKFTKHHNRVARKNLLKARKVKIAGGQSTAGKVVKRVARVVEPKKSSWSLSSLLNNVTAYFTGETTKTEVKKRQKRTHTSKKSAKLHAAAAAAATSTTAKPAAAKPAPAKPTTTTAAKK
ncbi:unnamed protein product [Adineta steineri]|uniref:60S ribosomal protein L29 n=1 Tax=Adineta steineri TaxID=433720 RepID=A0A814FCY4_9BILA|nr:unnamed protein product [Adineta steineri]CAF0883284.1 unnamed protein product [Adineta steineri]CAF0981288.1 unnamed protein product [Adineta steineri]CAF3482919.1 unnamed protein product [Adineta steineri]CAF3505686.1 unnamed protein product [Adineta steineri]